jgi:hypothetical protein
LLRYICGFHDNLLSQLYIFGGISLAHLVQSLGRGLCDRFRSQPGETTPRPALRAQASYPVAFLLGIKKLGHEADPSPPYGVSQECMELYLHFAILHHGV